MLLFRLSVRLSYVKVSCPSALAPLMISIVGDFFLFLRDCRQVDCFRDREETPTSEFCRMSCIECWPDHVLQEPCFRPA